MEPIETEKVNGYTVNVQIDPYPSNPREDDPLFTMAFWHKGYKSPDQNPFNDREEFKEHFESVEALIFPVYMQEQSHILYKLGEPGGDVGVGYMYITVNKIVDTWGHLDETMKDLSRWQDNGIVITLEDIPVDVLDTVKTYAVGELEDYENYANGNVYYWSVEDPDGNVLESCGGYYDIDDCMSEGVDSVPDEPYMPKVLGIPANVLRDAFDYVSVQPNVITNESLVAIKQFQEALTNLVPVKPENK